MIRSHPTPWHGGPILAITILAATAIPASGQAIAIYPVQAGNAQTQIARSSGTISLGYTVANNGPVASRSRIVARPILQDGGEPCGVRESNCTLAWYLDGQLLSPDTPVEREIGAYGGVQIVLKGRAAPLGIYSGSFVVGPAVIDANRPAVVQTIQLTRTLPDLGTDALVFGPGGIRTSSLFKIDTLALFVQNKSDGAVEVPMVTAQILRDDGSNSYSHDAGRPEVKCPPTDANASGAQTEPSWPQTLADQQRLLCEIQPKWMGPGRYRIEAVMAGEGIARASGSRDFTVRRHWLSAGLALFVGATGGGWFAGWQNSGRRRALQAADALKLIGKYKALLGGLSAGQKRSREIGEKSLLKLGELTEALYDISDADEGAKLDVLSARLPLLIRLAELEQTFFDNGEPPTAKPACNAAADAVAADPLPADANEKLVAFSNSLKAAAEIGARLARLAATARNEFFIRLRGKSATALWRLVQRVDTILLWVTIAAVTAIGVVTLWQPNPTWGGLGDFLVALFTGFAATAAGTAGLRELTANYTLGKLP